MTYDQMESDRLLRGLLNGFGVLVGLGGYFYLRSLGLPLAMLIGGLIPLAVAAGLGWVIGRILANRVDCDSMAMQAVGWATLVTWFLPPVGVLNATVVDQCAAASADHWIRYRLLGFAGNLASFICGGAGIILTAQELGIVAP